MRVAILTDGYPTERDFSGGIGTYYHSLARALLAAGHEVEVFAASSQPGVIEHEGVTVRRVPVDPAAIERWERRLAWKLNTAVNFLFHSAGLRAAFWRRHRERPFDLIESTTGKGTALLAGWRPPVPVSCFFAYHPGNCRRAEPGRLTLDQWMIEKLMLTALRRAAGPYAPSRCAIDGAREWYGVNLEQQPLPFCPARVAGDEAFRRESLGEEPYLLYYGQLRLLKGVDLFGPALAGIFPECPELRLVLIGRDLGREEGGLVGLIRRQAGAAAGRVTYFNHVPPARLYPLIAGARGVVLPSRVDNVPNTLLEAMHFGRAIVATRGASLDEWLTDGESGLLFASGDAADLGRQMLRLWRLPEAERMRLGEAARTRLAALAPEKVAGRMIARYERLIAAWRGR